MEPRMTPECVFCEIVCGSVPASIVWKDDFSIAAVDLRQFNAGHVLVMPRHHLRDVRELDYETGAALMATVVRVTRAVGAAFPNQGMSLWNSIGKAAFQEVPHLHIHVHPRMLGDGLLQVYPRAPALPDRSELDRYASVLRAHLMTDSTAPGIS